jgi:hypothetical protein
MTNASTNPRVMTTPVRLPPCSIRRARTRLPVSEAYREQEQPQHELQHVDPSRRCSSFACVSSAFRSESNRSSRRHEH